MKISNEQIIASAKRQRQSVLDNMSVEPWQGHSGNRKFAGAVGVAASLVGFLAGYALHANMPQPRLDESPVAQVIQVQHDTITQVQTVRDTIYETRVVTKYEPMLTKAEASPTFEEEDDTSSEQKACSMLCDDIPYELLAAGR